MALTGTKGLLIWCQRSTEGYNDVKVVNMTTSFRDGLAFCAIIHHFRPDLINFDSLSKENVWENNQLAFEVAEKELNIPSLLDPDDMVALPVPDKLSIMTYVSQYYNYFKNKKGAVELGIKPTAGVGRTTVKRPRDDPNPFKKEGITPAKKAFPANTCQVCGKKVYLVEKVVSNNKLYHRSCFKCNKCGGTLRPGAAKIGTDPSQIECQHHQDKIWSLRTNMANRIKQKETGKGKEGLESIWESQSSDSPKSTPVKNTSLFTKNSSAKPVSGVNAKPTVIRHPQQTPPPIPTNPPSKELHPHLSSQSSARAQFFSPTPERQPPQSRLASKEEEDHQRLKAGLITTLAGVMSKEEEQRKKSESISEESKLDPGSKETSIGEPTKPSPTNDTGQKTKLVKPALPSSKPKVIEEKSQTPSIVSQRTAMFSDNNNEKDMKMKEPVEKLNVKDDAKKVVANQMPEKGDNKPKEMEMNKPEAKETKAEDKTADTKPVIGGSGGVKAMINKMEQESANDDQVHRPGFKPPPQPQWKVSSKRRAPAPPPQKRNVRKYHVTPAEIQHEIADIVKKTEELEKKGIELEDRLRAEMKDDSPEESEELLMEWFEVVNDKNHLVRREGELVAQAQIQELEIQHAEVEYDMRVLMHKQEHQKTDEDIKKEEELLELLVALVQQRSTIVDRLEEDRIREQEEDETIRNMMQMKGKLLSPDQGLDRESVESKKEKKKKKKKKHKDKTKDKEKKKEKKKDKGDEP